MKKSTHLGNFVLLALLTLLIAACGGRSSATNGVPASAASSLAEVTRIMDLANDYWTKGRAMQAHQMVLFNKYTSDRTAFEVGIQELVANQANCADLVAATEVVIAEAISSNMDNKAIFSGLATESVSGEQATTECAQLSNKIGDHIVSNRAAVNAAYQAQYEHATAYQLYLSSTPEIDFINDLMSTYGDIGQVWAALGEKEIGVSDFAWLPTQELQVKHSNRALCSYYTSGEFIGELPYFTLDKFAGHEDSLRRLYSATWNSGEGLCTMYRMAALDFMLRPIVSQGTAEVINSGIEQSVFPQR